MICPVCKRELAATLSICLTCGTMMNDTVREELEGKIERLQIQSPRHAEPVVAERPVESRIIPEQVPVRAPAAPLPRPKTVTAELNKKNTSPTLIDFQHKNPTLPEWRIELQNSIRKRNVSSSANTVDSVAAKAPQPAPVAASTAVENLSAPVLKNEKVANALRRIEESKRTYSGVAGGSAAAAVAKVRSPRKPAVLNRSFPFNIVERTPASARPPVQRSPQIDSPKPQLVSSARIEKKKFDTNKLPPIPEPEMPLAVEPAAEPNLFDSSITAERTFERVSIRNEPEHEEAVENHEDDYEEIDDLAPLSMRFGASVFDLIIGGFAAALLLSPFLVTNANLATVSGFLAIAGAVLVVMFVYQTVTIAFVGRTFGMKLFSIEIIDAEANELPTLHQAAVNSSVYLLSLLCLGVGFLPALFNEERRTVHDMLSGTLLIREY